MLPFAPRAARIACAVLASAMLAACGGAQPAAPEEPVPEAVPTIEVAPVEPVSDPGRLIFAHPEDATKLDPADVTDGESLLVTWHLYEGLTRYVAGSTEVEPALATGWTASEDGLTWTFALREGVTFHDGAPFDAEAVAWNFARWSDKAHPAHFPEWEFTYWEYMFQGFAGETDDAGDPKSVVASVEATGPMTVTITLNRPNAPILQNLAMGNFGFSSPAAVEAAGTNYGTPAGTPIAAGTGPYRVEEWVADDHITLVANESYWGEAPATERVEFRVIPDGSARYLALAAGEIDGMNQVNPEDIAQANDNPDVAVVFEPANNVGYLGFNQAHAPWDNLSCRLAVAHAIDKQAIVDTLHAGDAEVAGQMMPPSLWGYNEALEDWPYDMEAANGHMATCLAEETMPEEIVFYVPPIQRFYFPKPKELGEFIQASLAGLGVVTRIESPEWGSTYIPDVRAGTPDLFLLGWGGDNGDPDNFLCQFFCGADASFNGDGEGNGLPPSPELDALLREAATMTDQAARQTAYEEANALIHDLVPAVPLVHRSPPLLFRSTVTGYTPSPLQTVLTRAAPPMLSYALRRLALVVPSLVGITFVTYLFLTATGDPCTAMLGERWTAERCDAIRSKYGLDDPVPVQYARYVGTLARGDLGSSVLTKRPVVDELADKFPATAELAFAAMLLAVLAGVPLGVVAAWRHNSATDLGAMIVALVGVSMPVFWLALMLIYGLAFRLDLFPTGGRLSSGLDIRTVTGMHVVDAVLTGNGPGLRDALHHLALPALALSTIPAAIIARITRSSMLEALAQDYVRTARAKGVRELRVVGRHALANAMLPVVTVIGLQMGLLLSGAVLTETLFAWPGMGRWVVEAISSKDIPVVQAGVIVFASVFVVINLVVDLSYAWLDPRIRLG